MLICKLVIGREQCWIVAHLELTDEEAARYKGIPVVYNEEVVSRSVFPSASSSPPPS